MTSICQCELLARNHLLNPLCYLTGGKKHVCELKTGTRRHGRQNKLVKAGEVDCSTGLWKSSLFFHAAQPFLWHLIKTRTVTKPSHCRRALKSPRFQTRQVARMRELKARRGPEMINARRVFHLIWATELALFSPSPKHPSCNQLCFH